MQYNSLLECGGCSLLDQEVTNSVPRCLLACCLVGVAVGLVDGVGEFVVQSCLIVEGHPRQQQLQPLGAACVNSMLARTVGPRKLVAKHALRQRMKYSPRSIRSSR